MADGELDGRAAWRSGHQPALSRRQALRAMLLGAAGLAVPAACGLPTGGHVIVDGPAKTIQPGSGAAPPKAPTQDAATSPTSLVSNFFSAVAGPIDYDSANEKALKFLTNNAKATWPSHGGGVITVVRLVEEPQFRGVGPDGTTVDVTFQLTGKLQQDGTVQAPTQNSALRTVRFTVIPNTVGPGYLIDKIQPLDPALPLPGLVLSSKVLDDQLFSPQLLYFWSVDQTGLVPDLRYVPKAGVSQELQFTDVVTLMLHGPSTFLQDAVQANLYQDNNLVLPNLPADPDGLVVNLAQPLPKTLKQEQVMAQLRWSLRPLYEGTVRLQVASQAQKVDGSSTSIDFRRWNLADQPRDDTEYCIANGVVRPVDSPLSVPPILPDDVNKDVRLAALSPDLKCAALVKNADGRLFIGEAQGSAKPTFNVATLNGQPLPGPTDSWTRPMFLPSSHRVLVGRAGLLYLVHADGQVIPLQAPVPVSAFSLAPDGRRIALISNGVPLVYSLKVNGDDISFGGSPRQIDAGLDPCTGITWVRLDRILIAGRRGGQYQIVRSTIDSAIMEDFGPPFSTEIRSIVALPPPAWDAISGLEEALVQAGDARQVFAGTTSNPASITFSAAAQPSPSPSGTPQGASPLGTPTYPFYLG